jgi:DNA invertase Pin-like site-specific DNA recombinase
MKLAAYRRVSTAEQVDGYGLDVQDQDIRVWARQHGHRIVAWFGDEGLSGSNGLEHRDGLADALAYLRSARAGGLVVPKLDRLARDLIVQEQVLGELWRIPAHVFSTASGEGAYLAPDDVDDPSRKLIRQILGAVNEYERAMIALRMRRGRRRKAELGGYAYGSPRFGYRTEDRRLVPDDAEQLATARIVELHREGRSLRQIAAVLEEEGLPAKRGGRWHPRTVSAVLTQAGVK